MLLQCGLVDNLQNPARSWIGKNMHAEKCTVESPHLTCSQSHFTDVDDLNAACIEARHQRLLLGWTHVYQMCKTADLYPSCSPAVSALFALQKPQYNHTATIQAWAELSAVRLSARYQ